MSNLAKLSIFIGALIWALAARSADTPLEQGITAYTNGDGKTALSRLQPLARRGDAEAQYYLGRVYYYDVPGVPRNYKTAARWFARAAAQGHAAAQYKIGGMYFSARGVAQDDRLTVKWWRLAAAQKHGETLNNLGALYANGRGVTRHLPLAYALQTLADENGAESAAENLRAKEAIMTTEEREAAQELIAEMRKPDGIAQVLERLR